MKLTIDLTAEQIAAIRAQLLPPELPFEPVREDAAVVALAVFVRSVFQRRYMEHRAGAVLPETRAHSQAFAVITGWLRDTALNRNINPYELATQLCTGFFASQKAAEAGYRPQWLAQDPLEYLGQPEAPRVRQPHVLPLTAEQERDLRGESEASVSCPPELIASIGRRV